MRVRTQVSITKMLAAEPLHAPDDGSGLLPEPSDTPATAPNNRWHLCAGFALYIAVGSFQQSLHTGSGRGSRRCGKRRRMLIRAVGITTLCVAQVPLTMFRWADEGHGVPPKLILVVDLSWLTLLAIVELAGMQRRSEAKDKTRELGNASATTPLMPSMRVAVDEAPPSCSVGLSTT